MRKIDTKKVTSTAIFLSLALMLSIVENLLPPLVPILPQAKIGIANIVILTSILLLGKWQALVIVIMRAFINAIFSGNPVAFLYSCSAGLVSYAVMVLLIKTRVLSLIAISSISAMVHNLIQVSVAALMTGSTAVFVYLPYLATIGGIAGAFIGLVSHYIVVKYPLSTLTSNASELEYTTHRDNNSNMNCTIEDLGSSENNTCDSTHNDCKSNEHSEDDSVE